MKFLTPIILLIVSAALFFGYVAPAYDDLRAVQEKSSQFDQALSKSRELQTVRDKLLSKFNTMSTADIDRLEKLLPDHVDNVRLILDLDSIASKYGMVIRNVNLTRNDSDSEVIGPDNKPYGSIKIDFTMVAPYREFVRFVTDLEKSLRLVDLETLSFRVLDTQEELLEYNVGVRTYWLK